MSENKRFAIDLEQTDLYGWTMGIIDYKTNESYQAHSQSMASTKEEMEDLCLLLNELNEGNKELKKCNTENSFMIDCFADEEVRLITENEAQKDTLDAIRVNIETVDKENTEDLKTTIELIETILQTKGAM